MSVDLELFDEYLNGENSPLFRKPEDLTNKDLTERKVDGCGTFDALMSSVHTHILAEFQKNRITGSEYAKAYTAMTEAAMGNSVQFLLQKENAYWQAVNGQMGALTARVQVDLAIKDLDIKDKELLIKDKELLLMDKELGLKDAEIAIREQELLLKVKELDLMEEQIKLAKEQMEAQRAQTMDTRSDGTTPVAGLIKIQKEQGIAQTDQIEAQTSHIGKQELNTVAQTSHITKQELNTVAQTSLLGSQKLNVEAQTRHIAKQELNTEAQTTNIAAQTSHIAKQELNTVAQTTLLGSQKLSVDKDILVKEAQILNTTAQTSHIAKQELNTEAQTTLLGSQKLSVDKDILVKDADIVNKGKEALVLDAQKLLIGEQMEVQRAQTMDTRSTGSTPISGTIKVDKELKTQEKLLSVAQTTLAGTQNTLVAAQKLEVDQNVINKGKEALVLDEQRLLVKEQMESQLAQTLDVRTDSAAVSGLIKTQKDLYKQQIDSYKRDAETKVGKLLLDTWTTQKTVDEGLTAPTQVSNANLDTLISALRTRNTI